MVTANGASAAVHSYYRRWAGLYDATRWLFLRDRARGVARLQLSPGDSVLEIGAGTGRNLSRLADAVGPAGHITLLDFSSEMLRRARRKRERLSHNNVDLVCADATSFHLDRRYDAVVFFYSLALIPHPATALETALRHLKPGGRLGVVEFGRSTFLGPFGSLLWRWLNLHNVYVCDEDLSAFGARHLTSFDLEYRRFGYNLIAAGSAPHP